MSQAGAQRRVQRDFQARATLILHRRARPVSRQFEYRLLIAQLVAPVSQLTLQLTGLHPLALPLRIIGVLDRQGWQFQALALAIGAIQGNQFLHQDLHRPAIRNDVVLSQQQHMIIRRQLQQFHPQQRPLLQIERRLSFGLHGGGDQRVTGQRFCHQRQCQRGINDLQRLLVLDKARTQAFMALDQRIETACQSGHVQGSTQTQGQRDVVRRTVGFQLPEEPLPFLGIGQQQRLLTIHRHQRRLATSLALAQGLDKGVQGGVFKQRTQRQFDIQRMAHPGNHLGGQQRMAAQFEEVVSQADTLQFEHVLPDLRDTLLQFVARGHEALLQLTGIRRRQGLAIQFAVRGQWQPLKEHPLQRHHVIGQTLAQTVAQAVTQCIVGKVGRCRHHVAHQGLASAAFEDIDRSIAYHLQFQQVRTDFTQLDPETTHLDLMVDAPHVLQQAIVTPTTKVTGAVQPATSLQGKWVRQVGHGRTSRITEVTTTNTDASNP
ncbi:hypothetical protein [Pseudomonas sp. 25 R 14]|nr:hypothetical protein [Pseudomonas sp. 25 R 14]